MLGFIGFATPDRTGAFSEERMFQLDHYLDKLQHSSSEEALLDTFDEALKDIGYAGYNIFYGYLDDRGRVTPELGGYDCSTLPASLNALYDQEEWYSVDPLLALGTRSIVPYSTASAFSGVVPGSVTETMWHAMLDYEIEHEINIPVRRATGAGQIAVHMMGRRKQDFVHFKATLPVAHMIATAFYGVLESRFLFQSPLFLTPGNPLTRRERDCLRWIAQGKSNPDIAERLGVSTRTVKFHAENAIRKLDAKTRTEAVAIALTRKYIEL